MEKRTFLVLDTTPRQALWDEIRRLGKQIVIQERKIAAKQHECDSLNLSLGKTADERRALLKECVRLQERLKRYDRKRGKSGKFVAGDERRKKRSQCDRNAEG